MDRGGDVRRRADRRAAARPADRRRPRVGYRIGQRCRRGADRGGTHPCVACVRDRMLGSYVRADVPAAGPRGRLAETQPQRNPRAREVFSNAVRVYLAGTRLWILDGNSISCAADATGRILTQAQGSSGYAGDLVPLAAGRLALAWNGRILISALRPPCGPWLRNPVRARRPADVHCCGRSRLGRPGRADLGHPGGGWSGVSAPRLGRGPGAAALRPRAGRRLAEAAWIGGGGVDAGVADLGEPAAEVGLGAIGVREAVFAHECPGRESLAGEP